MTLFSVATPATSMKYFTAAVAAMVWAIVFLFLATRFLFTPPIIAGIAIGFVALVYAMAALVGGTLRRVRQMPVHVEDWKPGQKDGSRMLTGTMAVGSVTVLIGVLGQLVSTWLGLHFLSGLWDLWLGLLVFGLVIQLYGQAAYLKNLA
jgi:hypothetical protein